MAVRKRLNLPPEVPCSLQTTGFIDDFFEKEANLYTTTAASTGTATVGVLPGGICVLLTAATDNDHVVLNRKVPHELSAAAGTLEMLAIFELTEGNTDDANFAIGFTANDPAATEALGDDAAGVTAEDDLPKFFLYKRDGDTRWRFWSSVSATESKDTELDVDVASGVKLSVRIVIDVVPDGIEAYCEIDALGGSDLQQPEEYDVMHGRVPRVKHRLSADLENVYAIAFLKAGSANIESVELDLMAVHNPR